MCMYVHNLHVCTHTYIHTCMYVQWNRPSRQDTLLVLVISRSIFSQKKSETSSEDISVRAVFLDDSLSAPRSRTWRTCFYLSLFFSQPEPNIRAWGKKIIRRCCCEVREVRYSLWERINDKSSSSERPPLSRPKRNASRQQLMIDDLVFERTNPLTGSCANQAPYSSNPPKNIK